MKRRDLPDTFFRTKEQKFRGIVSDVLLRHATGQPVLIATTTIAESEELHSRLQKENIQALIMIDLLKRDAADSNDPVWTASLYQQLKRPLKDISIVKLEAVMASRGLDPCPWSRANLAHFASLHRFVIDESMLTHLESAVRNGIEAPVLNARQYRRAGEIIKCAGKPYAGTVATNMAGRGVDIMLGGYECTVEDAELARRSGGLYVLGTERQTCRRMDNQLKGRSGRQGDPGESRFYVSLEDELLQPFIELLNGTERLKRSGPIASLVDRLSGTANNILDDCDSMVDPLLSRSVENLQKIIQGKTFERRKISLKFDDVLNIHRRFIYGDRRAILKGQDLRPTITGYLHSTIDTMLDSSHTSLVEFPAETDPENASALHVLRDEFDSFFPVSDYLSDEDWDLDRHDLSRKLHEAIDQAYEGNAPDPERIEYLHQRIESLMAESEMTPEGQRNDHDACWIVEHTYLERLYKKLGSIFDISRHVSLADLNAMGSEEWAPALHQAVDAAYSEREQEIIDSGKSPRLVEQHEALKIINEAWAEHLLRFEELRERAELRAFAKDPNLWFVFHREAFDCFNALKETIVDTLARRMFEPGVLEHGT